MSQNIDVSGRYTDTGNLLQIEYAKKAAAKGNTVIGIRFKDGVLLAVEKQASSRLVDVGAVQCISGVSSTYAMAYSGLAHDSNVMLGVMKGFCRDNTLQLEKEIMEESFVEALRYYLCYFSSYMSLRPVGCEFLVSSRSSGKYSLFYADPSGFITKCHAYALGCNAQAAKTELEKLVFTEYSLEDAVQCATRVFHVARNAMAEGPFEIEMMEISGDGVQRRVEKELILKHSAEYSDMSVVGGEM
ncbi:20S proteasome subunit alpha 7 [Nematocida sp. AWRm77]|nr:20S proteasome subunit alpha 7 [Nematocida sp. AWRm77]